jgi:hypothetical protein
MRLLQQVDILTKISFEVANACHLFLIWYCLNQNVDWKFKSIKYFACESVLWSEIWHGLNQYVMNYVCTTQIFGIIWGWNINNAILMIYVC